MADRLRFLLMGKRLRGRRETLFLEVVGRFASGKDLCNLGGRFEYCMVYLH